MPARHTTWDTVATCSNGEPDDYKVGAGTRQVRGGARGAVLGMACAGLSKSDGAAHHAEKTNVYGRCRAGRRRPAKQGCRRSFGRRRCTRWWWTRQCSWLGGGASDWSCPQEFPARRPWRAAGTTHLAAAGSSVPERICPVQVSRGRKKSGRTWWYARPRCWWSAPMGVATADQESAMAADSSSFGDMAWLPPRVVCYHAQG